MSRPIKIPRSFKKVKYIDEYEIQTSIGKFDKIDKLDEFYEFNELGDFSLPQLPPLPPKLARQRAFYGAELLDEMVRLSSRKRKYNLINACQKLPSERNNQI